MEVCLKIVDFYLDIYVNRALYKIPLSSNDLLNLIKLGDGVRVLKISLHSITESFIKIQQKEACPDSTYPQNLLLESWTTRMFLIESELESGY